MATLHDQIVKVNDRLAQLLAPQKEVEELTAKKQRLEQEQATQQATDAKAKSQAALHAASLQKRAAVTAYRQKLQEARPFGDPAAESILTEGRLLPAYYPGESEAVNRANSLVEEAIALLDPQGYAQF